MRRKVVFLSAIPWIGRRESSRHCSAPPIESDNAARNSDRRGGATADGAGRRSLRGGASSRYAARTYIVSGGDHPRVAVLVPAHDEALIISRTLRTIVPEMARGDRLVVVADNCTDETAALAAAEGAEVLVRGDLLRRGKGYALDFGIRHLASDAPEIVLIVDADCRVRQEGIDRLSRLSQRTGRPVQALYLMQAAEGASLKMRLAGFAWVIKNQVRPLGLHRLGLPCQLMGSGMASPWACINSADFMVISSRISSSELNWPVAELRHYFVLKHSSRASSRHQAKGFGASVRAGSTAT